MAEHNDTPPEDNMQSLNDVVRKYKAIHPDRNKFITNSHLTLICSWLVIRYLIAQPVINYFKDLIEEQRHGLAYNSNRSKWL